MLASVNNGHSCSIISLSFSLSFSFSLSLSGFYNFRQNPILPLSNSELIWVQSFARLWSVLKIHVLELTTCCTSWSVSFDVLVIDEHFFFDYRDSNWMLFVCSTGVSKVILFEDVVVKCDRVICWCFATILCN